MNLDAEGRAFYASGLVALVLALTALVVRPLVGTWPPWASVVLVLLLFVGVLGIGFARSGVGPLLGEWWREAPVHHPPPGRRTH